MLGKAVRRLGRGGGEHARLQEEMAWQVAEMFVKDVTRCRYLSLLQKLEIQTCDLNEGEGFDIHS